MNTKNLTQEQISAFTDSETADSHVELVLAALRQEDGRATWDAYHHIGDVLRSEEMAFKLRPDFMVRMAARLEEEPTIVAPKVRHAQAERIHVDASAGGAVVSRSLVQRFAFPGIAAAAVTALALISGPQLMVAMKSGSTVDNVPVMVVASTNERTTRSADAASAAASQTVAIAVNAQQDSAVLRDPRIDDYLLAHQRFSPSVFSTAQYARTATFSTDSNK